MPRPQLRRKHRVHGERQEAGGSGDALSLNDHGPVMQWGAGAKDRGQKIIGDARIQRDAAFDIGAQANVTFYDDQRAGLILRKQICRQNYVVVGVSFGTRRATEAKPGAQSCEGMANLRLKDHNQRENNIGKQSAEKPVQSAELADAGEIEGKRQDGHAHQHGRGPSAADQHQKLVNDHRHQQNVEYSNHRHVWPRR